MRPLPYGSGKPGNGINKENVQMKKLLLFGLYVFLAGFPLFSQISPQDIETFRYYDAIQDRSIAVKAVHIGWMQKYQTISNAGTESARLLSYTSIRHTEKIIEEALPESGFSTEWSPWEPGTTDPVPFANVNHLIRMRDASIKNFRLHPITGSQINGNILMISAIPNNRNVPVWFDESNNLHSYYKLYFFTE
jgi:hypothetical protein